MTLATCSECGRTYNQTVADRCPRCSSDIRDGDDELVQARILVEWYEATRTLEIGPLED